MSRHLNAVRRRASRRAAREWVCYEIARKARSPDSPARCFAHRCGRSVASRCAACGWQRPRPAARGAAQLASAAPSPHSSMTARRPCGVRSYRRADDPSCSTQPRRRAALHDRRRARRGARGMQEHCDRQGLVPRCVRGSAPPWDAAIADLGGARMARPSNWPCATCTRARAVGSAWVMLPYSSESARGNVVAHPITELWRLLAKAASTLRN